MSNFNEAEFINAIRARLDDSIAHLDPALSGKLDRSRESAVLPLTQSAQVRANDSLAQHVHTALNSDSPLPADINARLDAARQQAVARLQRREQNPLQILGNQIRYALTSFLDVTKLGRPANMLATAFVMVTVVSLFYASSRPGGTLPLEEEIVLIASADEFELYENLDFYLWLAENGIPN